MGGENQNLTVRLNGLNLKDVVHQYIKTCFEQLDVSQCAVDLKVDTEYVIKAVALLKKEGKINVGGEASPSTEAASAGSETKEPITITLITPSEEEAVQPSINFTAEALPEETPKEQGSPSVESKKPPTEALTKEGAFLEKLEVFAEEVSEEADAEEVPVEKPLHKLLRAPRSTS